VPVVGIGLLNQQGYFRQTIDKVGNQHELFFFQSPGQLPITPLRQADGEWLRVKVEWPGASILLRAWQVKIGRSNLYLLDRNDVANILGLRTEDLLALGRQNPDDPSENFNKAYLAIRGSGAISGVSQLHWKVSRSIFTNLFPQWNEYVVTVNYITNGVNMLSWDSVAADNLWTEACVKERWRRTTGTLAPDVNQPTTPGTA